MPENPENEVVFRVDGPHLQPMWVALQHRIGLLAPSLETEQLGQILMRDHGNGLLLDAEEQRLVLVALKAFPSPTAGMLDLTRLLQAPPGK